MDEDPWATDIPNRYQQGQLVSGAVTKITNFGVFVGLEDGLEGLLHITELADHKVENPQDVVNVGDELEVKILRVDSEERKIGLSRKRVEWAEEDEAAAEAAEAAELASREAPGDLKGGIGSHSGPLFKAAAATEAAAVVAEETAEAPTDTAETDTAETDAAGTDAAEPDTAEPDTAETDAAGSASASEAAEASTEALEEVKEADNPV